MIKLGVNELKDRYIIDNTGVPNKVIAIYISGDSVYNAEQPNLVYSKK